METKELREMNKNYYVQSSRSFDITHRKGNTIYKMFEDIKKELHAYDSEITSPSFWMEIHDSIYV